MTAPTLANLDMALVRRAALEGLARLAETDPYGARRLRRVVELQGGAALHVGLWEDGQVGIAIAGVEVAILPLEKLTRRLD